MNSFDLCEYPLYESEETFWLRMSVLSTLATQETLFVWEPAGAEPSLLQRYADMAGIDTNPKGLTYELIGGPSVERDEICASSLRLGNLPDHPDVVVIPLPGETLANAITRMASRDSGADVWRFNLRLGSQAIGVAANIKLSNLGQRTVCTFDSCCIGSVKIESLFPSTSVRQMEVSGDGMVLYCARRKPWRLFR